MVLTARAPQPKMLHVRSRRPLRLWHRDEGAVGRYMIYTGDWVKRTFRLPAGLRDAAMGIATDLRLPLDAIARIGLRRYAERRGKTLRGWVPLNPAKALTFFPEQDGAPRIWVRMPRAWIDEVIPGLYRGEIHTVAGVLRESLLELIETDPAERQVLAQAWSVRRMPVHTPTQNLKESA